MTISSEIKEQITFNSVTNKLEFQNFDEIYFPHRCIICKNYADKHIAKNLYGSYAPTKDYKKNYMFSLPVCDSCRNNIELKTGLSSKSGKLLLISIILGSIISILLFFILNSLLLSLSVFAISIIFPVRNYKIKIKPKIRFENHLKIGINTKNPDIIELEFSDKEYAKALEDINLSQIKLKQEQIEKKRQEKIEKEKQEQVLDSNETETQPIIEKIEREPSPVEIAKTEHVGEENINKEQNKTCPKCKKAFESKWFFCDNCGSPLK
ncbi:MAG: hypothetical protein ACTSR7_15710 [Promethearchaeota archaeon]